MPKQNHFPSIWVADFSSKVEFDASAESLGRFFGVIDGIDDRILSSRHGFVLKAYCAACQDVTTMRLSWHHSGTNAEGSVHPAWTETAVCEHCGLSSRMRALVDFLRRRCSGSAIRKVFAAERTTAAYKVFKSLFKNIVGSEFLGPDCAPGQTKALLNRVPLVRHEDLTRLSFDSGTFDLMITQDVFEHIPDFPRAFAESARVLAPGGRLVFTIPFFYNRETTLIRATIAADGSIEHHHPPEFHGNPVSPQGSLCFQHFGWDIVQILNEVGFEQASAAMYWGPWQGHLGFPFFVFDATRRDT